MRRFQYLNRAVPLVLAATAASACTGARQSNAAGAAANRAGATAPAGEASASERPLPPAEIARLAQPDYSRADVRFMQAMLVHHAQALEMTSLIAERTGSEDLRRLGLRIDVSQMDEMDMMRRWLEKRREPVPETGEPTTRASHGTHGADQGRMPGMASHEEMTRLAASSGAAFDRLFLELMIRHHEGALEMVAALFGTEDGGQEPEIFTFASHVDADQRMEIARMGRMLEALDRS